ncbi:MAG: sulfate ABC transporter substrate-binding protein [Candidatus Velthaea sp.]|jgi:sulfate transport system substrate-binding protein
MIVKAKPGNTWTNIAALALVVVACGLLLSKNYQGHTQFELLNVSYGPTREVYQELDRNFIAKFRKDTGKLMRVDESHGGSSSQARAVADGLAADVVTLALPSDIDSLRRSGLVAENWERRFPNASQPYYSTIVFVVRKGNPKSIHDWSDLTTPGVEVVTPDPKTSGNGRLSFLAAWGSVIRRGGTTDQARDLVTRLYRNVSVPGAGARDSSNSFEPGGEGDVQLTWENEAIREVGESHGELEIVYPPASIRAEPSVALVDADTAKHHSEKLATAYLTYLFSDEAQEVFARNGYRPSNPAILNKYKDRLPQIGDDGLHFQAKPTVQRTTVPRKRVLTASDRNPNRTQMEECRSWCKRNRTVPRKQRRDAADPSG